MMKGLTFIFSIFFSFAAFSLECQQMSEPVKTLCFQNAKTQTMISNLIFQISSEQRFEAPASMVCIAKCRSGHSYTEATVKEFFSNLTNGVSERLLSSCKSHLPETLRAQAYISNIDCKPL